MCYRTGAVQTREYWERFISSLYSPDAGVPEPKDSWERFERLAHLIEVDEDDITRLSSVRSLD